MPALPRFGIVGPPIGPAPPRGTGIRAGAIEVSGRIIGRPLRLIGTVRAPRMSAAVAPPMGISGTCSEMIGLVLNPSSFARYSSSPQSEPICAMLL